MNDGLTPVQIGRLKYVRSLAELMLSVQHLDENFVLGSVVIAVEVFHENIAHEFDDLVRTLLNLTTTGMSYESLIDYCTEQLGEEQDGTDPE